MVPEPAPRLGKDWMAYVLGLWFKLVGADWDMAWHFQRIKDATSPAHLLNAVGDAIIGVTLLRAWRHRTPERQKALNLMALSFVVLVVAVPLDQLWHLVFGIDLTTWSPTHLLLFSSTVVLCLGLVELLLVDAGWRPGILVRNIRLGPLRWALLIFLLVNVLDALAFPAVFQEYSVVGAWNYLHGESVYRLTPELRAFALTVLDKPYDDLPHALYPAYQLAIGVCAALFVRRLTGVRWLSVAVAGLYVTERIFSNAVLGATGWAQGAIPFHQILVAASVEATTLLRTSRGLRATVGALLATVASYGLWTATQGIVFTVPVDYRALPWATTGALLGAFLGTVAIDWIARTEPRWGWDPLPHMFLAGPAAESSKP